jgi:hypothetical protein
MRNVVHALVAVVAVSVLTPAVASDAWGDMGDNTWMKVHPRRSERFVPHGPKVPDAREQQSTPEAGTYSGIHYGGGNIFYLTRGAHGSYIGNDVEMYDIDDNIWIQSYRPETCPRDDAACNVLYKWGNTVAVTPLGRPYAEHTYDYYQWNPEEKRFWGILRSGTWSYDPSNSRWTYLAGPRKQTPSPVAASTGAWHLMSFDPKLHTFQAVVTHGSIVPRGVYIWRNGGWSKRSDYPAALGPYLYSVYLPDQGLHLVHDARRNAGSWWTYDALKDRWTRLKDVPRDAERIDSFDYDQASRTVIGVVHPNPHSFRVWAYEPESGSWKELPAPSAPPFQATGLTAVGNMLRYDPRHNVFFFLRVMRFCSNNMCGGPTELWAYRYKRASDHGHAGKKTS